MKKFYYFSKTKLKFVEIENFYKKVLIYTISSSIILSLIFFGSYLLIFKDDLTNHKISQLETENKELLEKLLLTSEKISSLTSKIDSLSDVNENYRIATNLEPVDDSLRIFAIGGSILDEIKISSSDEVNELLNSINFKIQELEYKINLEKQNYVEIDKKLKENQDFYDCLPAIKPAEGYFGDRFGLRKHPILKIRRMHNGLDIVCNVKTPVYATGNGKVTIAKRNGSLGRMVEIDHGYGYKTIYGHLYRIKVKKGQKVKRGDLIGLSGNSGLSTGPHLHYEVHHNGIALNPRNFIYDDVKLFELAKK